MSTSQTQPVGSIHERVRLSPNSIGCLRRAAELSERITPGNCSHHRGNILLMLRAVLAEVEQVQPNADSTTPVRI